MWKDFPAELCAAAGARGLVFSRHGYGRSTPRPAAEKWPVDFMHAQAQRVLPALVRAASASTTPPWLFGHSDGALHRAALCGRAFPERVAGVVAVAPHVFVEDVSVASIEQARAAYADDRSAGGGSRATTTIPTPRFTAGTTSGSTPPFARWNIEACLPRIRCPVLAVQGEDDEYGTMAQIDAIARLVPQARAAQAAGMRTLAAPRPTRGADRRGGGVPAGTSTVVDPPGQRDMIPARRTARGPRRFAAGRGCGMFRVTRPRVRQRPAARTVQRQDEIRFRGDEDEQVTAC